MRLKTNSFCCLFFCLHLKLVIFKFCRLETNKEDGRRGIPNNKCLKSAWICTFNYGFGSVFSCFACLKSFSFYFQFTSCLRPSSSSSWLLARPAPYLSLIKSFLKSSFDLGAAAGVDSSVSLSADVAAAAAASAAVFPLAFDDDDDEDGSSPSWSMATSMRRFLAAAASWRTRVVGIREVSTRLFGATLAPCPSLAVPAFGGGFEIATNIWKDGLQR